MRTHAMTVAKLAARRPSIAVSLQVWQAKAAKRAKQMPNLQENTSTGILLEGLAKTQPSSSSDHACQHWQSG